MTRIAKSTVAILALTASLIAAAGLSDQRQRAKFDEIDSNIHTPSRTETRATVAAKLGHPDLVFAADPQQGRLGCAESHYYRPTLRILDEEYLICFDSEGRATHAAYLVSQ